MASEMLSWLPMRWQVTAVAVVVLGATACASRPSPPLVLVVAPIDYTQPATIAGAIGGQRFTGYVRLSYGEDDRVVITSSAGIFAFACKKAMADWAADGRAGKAPCATVTIELAGEPPNFHLASGWTAAPLVAKSLELLRAGVGFSNNYSLGSSTTAAVQPLLSSMLREMYGSVFELVGTTTPEACEALRPRNTKTLIDGHCQAARLIAY
jgi:hypothetical protein